MNSYENYIYVLKHMLKNFDGDVFNDIIKSILLKIFDIYYLERDIQPYNIDNVFKKYNMNMYNLLSRKYVMTKSKKPIFIKHKYNKKELYYKSFEKQNYFRRQRIL